MSERSDSDLDVFIRHEMVMLRQQLEELTATQAALQTVMVKVHNDVSSLQLLHAQQFLPTHQSPHSSPHSTMDHSLKVKPFERVTTPCHERTTIQSSGISSSQLQCMSASVMVHQGCADYRGGRPTDGDPRIEARVRETFYNVEEHEEAELHRENLAQRLSQPSEAGQLRKRVRKLESEFGAPAIELVMDSVMCVVICLHAIFIGVALDSRDDAVTWIVGDGLFSLAFFLEMISKIVIRGGICKYLCGKDSCSSILDALLVVIDVVQFFIELLSPWGQASTSHSASLFRFLRLVRLSRILHVLNSEKFKHLLPMINGLLNGMVTLGWVFLLFFSFMYVVALVCIEVFKQNDASSVTQYFETVPRSLFTVFRCSFGDCSNAEGLPLFEQLAREHGIFASLCCCLFLFFVTIGLFNIISAIFVDSTMAAAATVSLNKQLARLEDKSLWAKCVAVVIKRILQGSPEHANIVDDGSLFRSSMECRDTENVMTKLLTVSIRVSVVDAVVNEDKDVANALKALDIDPADHKKLSDILDPDHSGTITMLELVDGLQRLRGHPRRSDTVAVDLMVRALQNTTREVLQNVREILTFVHKADVKRPAHEARFKARRRQVEGDAEEDVVAL